MKLSNQVDVTLDPDVLFALLQDMERIAPCLPGARLEGRDGDDYLGSAKVKVGPITVFYRGSARFSTVDAVNRRTVLTGRGTELTGSGGVEATVEVQVLPHAAGSRIIIETELSIRGKVAQFGRGILGDVSQNLIQQFAANLSQLLVDGGSTHAATSAQDGASIPMHDSLDGLSLVAGPIVKRYGPLAAAFAAGVAAGIALDRLMRSPH